MMPSGPKELLSRRLSSSFRTISTVKFMFGNEASVRGVGHADQFPSFFANT